MITLDEIKELASEHNYERTIRESVKRGYTQVTLYFGDEELAKTSRTELIKSNFICTSIRNQFKREGTEYSFDVKGW